LSGKISLIDKQKCGIKQSKRDRIDIKPYKMKGLAGKEWDLK
jgi:hypothetical protein